MTMKLLTLIKNETPHTLGKNAPEAPSGGPRGQRPLVPLGERPPPQIDVHSAYEFIGVPDPMSILPMNL